MLLFILLLDFKKKNHFILRSLPLLKPNFSFDKWLSWSGALQAVRKKSRGVTWDFSLLPTSPHFKMWNVVDWPGGHLGPQGLPDPAKAR